MASPQTENGYTKIANELLEAIIRARFKRTELAVVLYIARMSYGWSARKTKPLTVYKMAKDIDAPSTSVYLAVEVLIENKVLLLDELGRFSINKDYEAWLKLFPRAGIKLLPPAGITIPTGGNNYSHRREETFPPAGINTDEPKERKKYKESVKGNGDTNTPSISDIVEYASEINKVMDCRRFFDHYTANGWMRGKSPIVDWKAVLRLWEDDGGPAPAHSSIPKRPKECEHCQKAESVFRTTLGTWACQPCYLEREGKNPAGAKA